jgi:phosphatidylglycerophosphate synthase
MGEVDAMLKKAPYAIVILRLLLTPAFVYAFILDITAIAFILYIAVFVSDIVDGNIARRLETTSSSALEAYLDPVADFVFVTMSFYAFSLRGFYPTWVLIAIVFMFLLFVTSSKGKKPLYDPVGKYYGTFLVAMIGITLLLPIEFFLEFAKLLIVAYTFVLAIYRLAFVWKMSVTGQ